MKKALLTAFFIIILVRISFASPTIMPYRCDGTATNTFSEGEDLCVYGVGFEPNSELDILVVNNQDDYDEGQQLLPVAKKTVTTTSSGLIALERIWKSIVKGLYDIIVDIARNGIWNKGDATNIGRGAGVIVEGAESTPEPVDVPEFTTIGSLLVLIGAGIIIRRRRK